MPLVGVLLRARADDAVLVTHDNNFCFLRFPSLARGRTVVGPFPPLSLSLNDRLPTRLAARTCVEAAAACHS